MKSWWKLALAAVVGAAIAAPAVVIAHGGSNATGDAERFLADSRVDVETEGSGWTPVIGLPGTSDELAVTVTAEMTKGEAKFRIHSSSASGNPPSATFSAGASTTAVFGSRENCPGQTLEIKRKGNTKAVADLVTVLSIFEQSACV